MISQKSLSSTSRQFLLLLSIFGLFVWGFYQQTTSKTINYSSTEQVSTSEESTHKSCTTTHHHPKGQVFCSVSPYPDPITMEQPDGSTFQALIVDEEGIIYLETIDGYSILKDSNSGYYKYAATGLDGDLFLSGATVSAIENRPMAEEVFLSVITPHLRYTGITKQKKKDKNDLLKTIDNPLPQGIFPPTGTQKALLILIDFPDQLHEYSVQEFDNLANQVGYNVNGQSGSFRDYYLDVSYGLLTVNTNVIGWATALENRADYGIESTANRNFRNAVPLMREAVDYAEAQGVDFSEYDGDGDGRVDVVEVIHSGRGAEESGNVEDIWSHRWVLSAESLDVTYDGVVINDYITQAEKLGSTNIANIGVFVHEFGHALGLPDLYDTNGGSRGLGRWCLMAGGTWNNGGKTPAHPVSWCKDQLGWVNKTVLTGSGSITNMDYMDNSDVVYQINTNNPDQYFLLENRLQTGWDNNISGSGLLIFHIDESRGGNSDETRYKVHLEQADGNEDLNNNSNSGDTGDPYPGSSGNTVFDCSSTPNSNEYDGTDTEVSIANISYVNNLASFDYGSCQCSITSIIDAGTGVTNFNDIDMTYDYDIIVNYRTAPTSGTLDITAAGQTYNVAIGTSPQTITLTGLPADGNMVDVTATFSDNTDCTASVNNLFTAPIVECAITSIEDAGTGVSNFNNATYDYDIIVNYRTAPTSGTLDITAAGQTYNVAIGTSPQTITLTGLPADGSPVDITAIFSDETDCTGSASSLFTAPETCLNDNVCDAIDITSFINGANVGCNNLDATVQAGEPVPRNSGCNVQNGWCNTDLISTIWFTFTAPASGSIDIDFVTAIDLQMAIWEADNCNALLNANTRMMVAANDDSGTAGGYSPRIENLTCLIPGKTYFIQLDGYNATRGMFEFTITDPGLSCGTAPLTTGGCATDHTATSGGNGEWMHIRDANGAVIASINDKFNNLGEITTHYAIHGGAVRLNENTPYLDRDWEITPTNNLAACVRLYFTQQELLDLQAVGGPTNLSDFIISKLEGTACSDFNTVGTQINPTTHMDNFETDKHMLQFDVDNFSTFFAHGNAVLPVELTSFTGKVNAESNLLNWTTASEENTCEHVVERMAVNGRDWEKIGSIAAAGSSRTTRTYTFEDKQPLLQSYYRIKTIDCDEQVSYSDALRLERTIKELAITSVYPIPAADVLNVNYASPQVGRLVYQIRDVAGRLVYRNEANSVAGQQNLGIDVSRLAAGAYILVLQQEQQLMYRKFVKE